MRFFSLAAVLAVAGCDPAAGGTTDRGARGDRGDVPPDEPAGDVALPDAGEGGGPSARDAGPGADRTDPRDGGEDSPPPAEPDAGGDALGECTGTDSECLAARLINVYRARHVNEGECNHPLRWDANLGRLAHEHQSGPWVRHSSHGYIENVGNEFSVEGAVEWILEYTPGIEEHCRSDGSYVASHHCAGMFCNNYTVGVGVYQGSSHVYMTMMFGDRNGDPSW